MISETTIMQDASEIIQYDTIGIPLYIRTDRLSTYPDKRALCHWHEDIEFIHILEGSMYYRVNGSRVLLKENDCIMVNARQMHYGYAFQNQDCAFCCVLFHPQLFTGNQLLIQKYILPLTCNPNLEFIHFGPQDPFHDEAAGSLSQIAELKKQAQPGYEMAIIGIMNLLWSKLARLPMITAPEPADSSGSDLTLQRDMVSYIYQHYTDRITLADIAAAGNVSRSKCCAIFKYYLQQSPIDFLNHYRLKVSCSLLAKQELNVTQAAVACGFNHLSYYSKLFYRNYGCTPSEYRRRTAGAADGAPLLQSTSSPNP